MNRIDQIVTRMNGGETVIRGCSFLNDVEARMLILLADAVVKRTILMDAWTCADYMLNARRDEEPEEELIECWAKLNSQAHSAELVMRHLLLPLIGETHDG
jgi:hypothetical protein